MGAISLSLFITAGLNLMLALIVYGRGGKNIITRYYAAAVASVGLWAFGHAMFNLPAQELSLFWFYFTYVAGSLIASYFFRFATIFPSRTKTDQLSLVARFLSVGFPILVLAGLIKPEILVQSIQLTEAGRQVVFVNSSYFIYSTGFSLLMAWGFLHLLVRHKTSSGKAKMQIRYVMVGTGIATLAGSYFNLWLPLMGNATFMWLGPHFSVVMIAFIAYAIVKHRLMDIRLMLSRTIVYSLLLASTLVLYTMLIFLAQRFFQDKTDYITSLVIGSLLIAFGFEPLRQLFQRATERVFFRGELDTQRLLSDLGEVFSTVRDLESLLDTVANQLSAAFHAHPVILAAMREGKKPTVSISGGRDVPEALSDTEHALIRYYVPPMAGQYLKMPPKQHTLLHEELIEITPMEGSLSKEADTQTELINAMDDLHIAVAVPIFTKAQFTGLMLLGPKRSGESFHPADLKLLEIIARQAGVAIDNAHLYLTLQEQMEELKRSQSEQLLQSAKLVSIGELATNVAHEINNPLTSILGFTSLILGDLKEDSPIKKDMKIIESEALRSREIVRNLLDFARRRPVKRELCDINQLILKTLNLLRHQANISNISLSEMYDSELPAVVVDADQMRQVFINLLKNAFDAMPNGGTLTVSTFSGKSEELIPKKIYDKIAPNYSKKIVEIHFKDTGTGISKEHMKRVFESFFTTKEEMGTGLGLAVSYGIIEHHSGRMEVVSEEGSGATFIIKLPVQEEIPIIS